MSNPEPVPDWVPRWALRFCGAILLLSVIYSCINPQHHMTGEEYAHEREIQRRADEDAADLEHTYKQLKGESLTDREKATIHHMAEQAARSEK